MHLSAYALWRINWIHPFVDGNGRTARIISYVILCTKFGFRLPGIKTIPEQIAAYKEPYYKALEFADKAFEAKKIDVSQVEKLIESSLTVQLETAIEGSKGVQPSTKLPSKAVIEGELLVDKVPSKEQIMFTLNINNDDKKNIFERNPVVFNGVFAIFAAIIAFLLGRYL